MPTFSQLLRQREQQRKSDIKQATDIFTKGLSRRGAPKSVRLLLKNFDLQKKRGEKAFQLSKKIKSLKDIKRLPLSQQNLLASVFDINLTKIQAPTTKIPIKDKIVPVRDFNITRLTESQRRIMVNKTKSPKPFQKKVKRLFEF